MRMKHDPPNPTIQRTPTSAADWTVGPKTMKCWICGNEGDSGEHRIKKSDLIAFHGKGPYKNDKSLVMIKDGKQIPIQGPNSKYLKYSNSLCSDCNNTATQEFDRAYSTFVNYVNTHEELVLKKRFIDFEEIYGPDLFEIGQRHLYKYFMKSFGCRLVEAGLNVPRHLVDLLQKERFQTKLRITFAVNEDKVLLMKDNVRIVGNGELYYTYSPVTREHSFQFFEYFGFIHIYYWYSCFPDGRLGAPWNADSKFIYLGSLSPLTPEMRSELSKKTKRSNKGIQSTPK